MKLYLVIYVAIRIYNISGTGVSCGEIDVSSGNGLLDR